MIRWTWFRRIAAPIARPLMIVIMLLTGAQLPLFGQVAGATLSGTVTDRSQAVVASAQVTIKNTATGVSRTVKADHAGFYAVPNLLPGSYQVTASYSGFQSTVENNVELAVGAQQTLNIALSVGRASETVTVTSQASGVETSTAALSAVVGSTTVRELPLNGRDWTQLATLEPGVTAVNTQSTTSSATANRGNRGYGNQLTNSGHSPYENNYRVNGISTNDYTNGSPGSVIGVNLGVDAIQEFSVFTTNYSSEYGRASGAVINAITKSGTNNFHGSAYAFFRNAALDAKNYFDLHTPPIPPFQRYQFGASGGGPIKKGKTFIFGDYESIRQSLTQTFTNNVPSAAARQGVLCSIPIASGPNACTTNHVGVSPLVQPYLAFWPTGNGALSANGDTQIFTYPGSAQLTENYATVRLDQNISSTDLMDASWFYDHAPETVPDPLGTILTGALSSRQMYSLEETHTFSASFVNTARVGFSRVVGVVNSTVNGLIPAASDTSLGSVPGRYAPIMTVPGLAGTSSLRSPSENHHVFNSFQYYDDAFLTRGKQTIHFGFAAEHMQYNHQVTQAYDGNFTFGSLQSFLEDSPTSILILGPNSSEAGTRQTLFGVYVEDDWRLRSNLTINAGLRYEPTNLPTEAHNRFQVLNTPTSPALSPVHTLWPHNATLLDFSPRVGFSYDPFKTGETAVRGAFGIYDVLPINWVYTFSTGASAPFASPERADNLETGDFPILKSTTLGPAQGQVRYMQPNPKRSYTMNWNLNVQQQVTPSITATIAYVGAKGVHLPDTPDDINYSLPAATPAGYMWPCAPKDALGNCTQAGSKLNPNVGPIRPTYWDNVMSYHGLQLGVTKNLSRGFKLQGSYNWGKCIDTGSNPNLSDPYNNSLADYMYFAYSTRRGLCDYNIAQSFILSYIWSIPSGMASHGMASKILGGWQLGGILRVQTGSPFTMLMAGDPLHRNAGDSGVDFPDRIANCNAIAGRVTGYVNVNCFGPPAAPNQYASSCDTTQFSGAAAPAPSGSVYCANLFGNAGRNQLTGPGLLDLDSSLFKNIPLTILSDKMSIQLRAEMFNILNHPNFLPPLDNSTIFNQDGSLVTGAGAIDSTSTDPRQIQFGIRAVW
jgi:hypothetical protein